MRYVSAVAVLELARVVDSAHGPVLLSQNAGAPVEGLPFAESRPFQDSDNLPKWRPSLQTDCLEPTFHRILSILEGNAITVAWEM